MSFKIKDGNLGMVNKIRIGNQKQMEIQSNMHLL